MPTYLYECPIHKEFEVQHSITEELECCPHCLEDDPPQHQIIKRLIASGGGFILHGGGWASEGYSK